MMHEVRHDTLYRVANSFSLDYSHFPIWGLKARHFPWLAGRPLHPQVKARFHVAVGVSLQLGSPVTRGHVSVR